MTQSTPLQPAQGLVDVPAVRVRLSAEQSAPQPDPLGRSVIGYSPGLTPSQLWQRGRGVWRARLSSVAEAQLALVVASVGSFRDVVVAVGTVEGVSFHDGRVAIEGRVLPAHPLVGQPDPLANTSRNPVAFGLIRTVPVVSGMPRPVGDVLADAVRVLTEAARLRRPRMHRTTSGQWEPDPENSEPGDWAELVTLALAGAAANIGGIEVALSGRPGSWEADGVRQLLHSTVGVEQEHLWQHRTEPVAITVYVDELLAENSNSHAEYDQAVEELDARAEQAIAEAGVAYDTAEYAWEYERNDTGDWIPRDPTAPAWSWQAWREASAAAGANSNQIAEHEQYMQNADTLYGLTATIPKNNDAATEMNRRDQLTNAIQDRFADLQARLEHQRRQEWTTYGQAFKTQLEAAAAATNGLTVPLDIRIDVDTYRTNQPHAPETRGLEEHLLQQATNNTPTPDQLPGSPLQRLGHP